MSQDNTVVLSLSLLVFLARDVYITSRAYATMSVSRLSVTEVHWVAVHAGNTATAPASKVEAIIRSPTNMAAVNGGVISRYARPSCLLCFTTDGWHSMKEV